MPDPICRETGLPVCPAAPQIARQGERLDAIHEEQIRTREDMRELRESVAKVASMTESVARLSQSMYGNGQPGLIRRVDRCAGLLRILVWVVGLFAVPAAGAIVTAFCWAVVKLVHL
jgi:hypothetical protein